MYVHKEYDITLFKFVPSLADTVSCSDKSFSGLFKLYESHYQNNKQFTCMGRMINLVSFLLTTKLGSLH